MSARNAAGAKPAGLGHRELRERGLTVDRYICLAFLASGILFASSGCGTPAPSDPDDRIEVALEPYLRKVHFYDGEAAYRQSLSSMPPEAVHLLAISWCDTEVCNGGFHQLFLNSTGLLAPEAAQGFREVGLPECAEVLEEAIGKFATPYPREQKDREKALEAMVGLGPKGHEWDPFHDLNSRYYEAKTLGNFHHVLGTYSDRLPPSP